ncbi:Flp pilus assembly protein TadG [Phycicoccus badiiscoriae]|uniref:Flp pilus assembly protein TadG n=1 Tax=Pedococcus badiiscoriae TaxID=642776 RepID=A0A852WEP2_9MICO|nr:pilus assembly protein TadG-related protein [Pedococcus badiiscoriae]NYG07693.1 Flp pilus assembly protein TadG [Pedococcus badiiscoriae]
MSARSRQGGLMALLSARIRGRLARGEEGYVAVTVAIMLTVLLGFCAFAVDVGNWYFTGQRAQRAADAAALAGVPFLPNDPTSAFAFAQSQATKNDFSNGGANTVTPSIDGRPTRLRVTINTTVTNQFGWLMGVPTTTVSRTAVADYAGPVPMGSPCNEYGQDPDAGSNKSANCNNTAAFWANVGSKNATKGSGDAFQNGVCAAGNDGCVSGVNADYDPNGYVYLVNITAPVTNLQIEAFDPAQVVVGDHCDAGNLSAAKNLGANAPPGITDASTRYAPNDGPWCTGDAIINGGNGLVKTQFTVYSPGANTWDPLSWPVACNKQFLPFNGDLSKALDKRQPNGTVFNYNGVADNFRRWVNLCSIPGTVPAGTYAVQVKTNGLGADGEGGHNRFGLRAYGSGSSDKDNISVAGFNKMAMYGNTPNGRTKFFLARVPSGAHGQLFNVRLFDIGDGAVSGSTIQVLPPSETGGTFPGCVGTGPSIGTGNLTDCTISVDSSYNGKWEKISVPIPQTYSCTDSSPTGCWVRLEFYYGSGSTPNDTTSWTANIEGDPVRLVQ